MKTIILPSGNAFGVDDNDGLTPSGEANESLPQTLFLVWVTLTEHKRVILAECRGAGASVRNCIRTSSAVRHVETRTIRIFGR
jgi:hypothetical protein